MVSVPAVISASDEDTNVLNVNFGYGTLAKMSVEEVKIPAKALTVYKSSPST